MKIRELKEKSTGELQKLLAEDRERVRALRFGVSVGQETKVRRIRAAKKEIARILTLLAADKAKPKA